MKDLVSKALQSNECTVSLEFLLYEYWEVKQGLQYIAGIHDYSEYFSPASICRNDKEKELLIKIVTMDQQTYTKKNHIEIVEAFHNRLKLLQYAWDKEAHPKHNPPEYFIVWAKAKAEPVYWFDDAMQQLSQTYPRVVVDRFYTEPKKLGITKQSIKSKRKAEIVRVVDELGLARFSLTDEDKKIVRAKCLKDIGPPTVTESTFKAAWQNCLTDKLIGKVN